MVPDGNAWQVIIQARFGVLFQDAALASDYQVFATRVTRGPLDVQSISAEKAVTA
jgi:ABC-type transporter Mla maintaining outer membrane lipid asymmetry ATPase subunit MlaF